MGRPAERGGQGGQMPRGPATFRGPVGPGRAHSQHCQLYFGPVTALYMRARDRSAQGPGFSLGGPAHGYIAFSTVHDSPMPKTKNKKKTKKNQKIMIITL